MNARDIKGLAIASLDTAAKLGNVEDILFDTTELRVAALEIAENGQRAMIPFADIHAIGRDAVTVSSSQITQMASAGNPLAELPRLEQFMKLKVLNEDGTLLGRVSDVEINVQTGAIIQIECHRGGLLGIGGMSFHIQAQAIRRAGADMIVVTHPDS